MEQLIEKFKVYGEEKLLTKELLSIAIWGESTNEEKLKIAENLINNNKDFTGDLRFLIAISFLELMEQGLTKEEALRAKAISGVLKRLFTPINVKNLEINSSRDVANLFMSELRFEKSEIVKLVILTNKNLVLKIMTLSKGTINSATVTPKDVLSEPIKMKAARIILVHNHPSGDSKPSKRDIQTTQTIKECADIMGIELLDHIVIGDGTWHSAMP